MNVSTRTQARFLREMTTDYPELTGLTEKWAALLATLDAEAPHSICTVLRAMRADTMWMDSILVDCPLEGVCYGTRRWPRGDDGVPF